MKKIVSLFAVLFSLTLSSHAQQDSLLHYTSIGVQLHDEGKYDEAIQVYQKALTFDKESELVMYELSMSLFSSKKFEEAIDAAEVVLKKNEKFVRQALLVKANCLDLLGDTKKAIRLYEKGVKKFPNEVLFPYNLSYTYYRKNAPEFAEEWAQKAILSNSQHAGSHVLLSNLCQQQERVSESILSALHFLLLEPVSERGTGERERLSNLLNGNIETKGEEVIIHISPSSVGSDFGPSDMILGFSKLSNDTDSIPKTEDEIEFAQLTSFLSVLDELSAKKKGFFWDFYVQFFADLKAEGHLETFYYYISLSKNNEEVIEWFNTNDSKIKAFSAWYDSYQYKTT